MQLILVSAWQDRFLRQNRHFPFDMQRLPSLPKAVLLVAIVLAALQLTNVAKGLQEPPAATPPAESAPAPVADADAEALIKAARERLAKWKSIQAKVVQRVSIGDRKFEASGRFFAGEFPRLRLEFEVKVGNTTGKLLEVCDGQVLHVERRIEDAKPAAATSEAKPASDKTAAPIESTRRDVQRILRAASDAEGAALSMHAADIGLGGVSALLASLERTMVFDSLREETHDGQTFRIVQGQWNPKVLNELNAKLGGLSQQLAGFLPERVRIDFEADSLFPVRILYLKLASVERRAYRPMLSLEFHDVEFDAELPPDTFIYRVPAGTQQKDDTDQFVQLLKASQQPAGQPAVTQPTEPPLNLKK
jgi:hypothetical protein